LEISQRPELPHREDFYYSFEYNLEKIEAEFSQVLAESKFQTEDKERILVALALAKSLHEGQVRREAPNLPYIVHPIEVATGVLKRSGHPNMVIAALFHDVREDVDWMRALANGEVSKKFESRVIELLTRLLSKYRLENFDDTPVVIRLTDEEYFCRLEGEIDAVFIKAIDRRKNLMSLGRMLDAILNDNFLVKDETIDFVREKLQQTKIFVIPMVHRKYEKLASNLEDLTIKLEVRLKIAETFLLQNPSHNL